MGRVGFPKFLRHCYGRLAILFLVLGSTVLNPSLAIATQVVPLSLDETVRMADAIVLGTVTAGQSRWGDASQRFMLTDYTLAVENVIHPSEKGDPIGSTVVLTYWGGTIGNETQSMSDVRLPKVGERLLVMLRPDWSRQVEFTPVVGFNQGLFSVVNDVASGASLVLDASGQRLTVAGVNVVRGPGGSTAASLQTFINWLRTNVALIKKAASEFPPQTVNDPRVLAVFAMRPVFDEKLPPPDVAEPYRTGLPGLPTSQSGIPKSLFDPNKSYESGSEITVDQPSKYVTLGPKPNLPITVNQFPSSFAPWSPEDQYQMSNWNFYSNVFRIFVTPTGTYGWSNDRFDLAGWPNSADLQSVYGSGWGANVIGITFWRSSGSTILEADIALNPAFSFTLDDEWVYDGSPAQGFRQVMTHELGHMLGLDHNFDYLAVMNYMPAVFRAFGLPYMDDAQGIRAVHPSTAVARTDLGVYLYYASGFQSVTSASFPSSVTAGGSLTVNNYHVENVGTTTIATPTIEWYLTQSRNFSGAYYSLGTSTYSSLATFTYFTPSTVSRTFTVPANVPAGSYYLAAYIPGNSGLSQGTFPFSNDYAFSRSRITVTTGCADPYEPNDSLATAYGPLTSGNSYGGRICSSSDQDWFKVTLSTAGPLSFGLTVPSTRDYDIELYNSSGTLLAQSVNGTGASELISYAASTAGTYLVKVFGYNGAFDTTNAYSLSYSLSAPPPALSISKTHSGNLTRGQQGATYTVTVSNQSGAAATSGTVTVTETVPSGLTLVSMSGTGWTCTNNVCTRSNALSGGASYPALTVTVNVSPAATSPQVNAVAVTGGGSANASTTDSTTVIVPGSSSIVIINNDAAGLGFNDPTAASPVGGNAGTTLGQQRLNVFTAAASKWAAVLNSPVPIRVRASWSALSCNANSAVLGSAGATTGYRDFGNAPVAGHWYPKALANAFVGSDLDLSTPDINANFNVNLGQAGCLTGVFFYLGLDNNHGNNVDLYTVLLHELAHGLGFQTFTSGQTGAFAASFPSIWDDFILDNTTNKTWAQMTASERVASAINNGHLVWNGANVKSALPSVLTPSGPTYIGADSQGRALLYAPTTYQGGSSVSHYDTTAAPNQLMEPAINSNLQHEVTPPVDLTFSLLKDIGWAGATGGSPVLSISKTHSGNFTRGQQGATYTVTVSNQSGAAATSGTVTVTETAPSGLTLVSMSGTGWTCITNVCTRSDGLTGGASYPALTVTVNVSPVATSPQVNAVAVSGGGSANANTIDSTTIIIPGSSSIIIINNDAAGLGFNDPTAANPVGGNTGTTLGQQRLNVFAAAASKWAAVLNSPVPIRVRASWSALSCNANSAVLGSAGATQVYRDFGNAPVAGHWYSKALANAFVGSDLDLSTPDINANFNVNLGQAGCLTGVFFYLGLDNNHGNNVDLFTVLLHELGHGLGFQTFTNGSTGALLSSFPSIWDDFILDNTTNKTWTQMTAGERVASAINNGHLVWNGANVKAAVPSVLTPSGMTYIGADSQGRPLLYAPITFQGGSSVSHYDTTAAPNQLMEPAINSNLQHEVTPPVDLTSPLLKDIGWTLVAGSSPPILSISKTHSGNFTTGQQGATYTVTVSNLSGAAATSGTVTVTETVPSGLTLASMSGTGWTCITNVCTRSNALSGGTSYPALTVTVNVSPVATSPQVNAVAVSGGGSTNANTIDSTVIDTAPTLSISKTHNGNFGQGQQGATYTVTVSNLSGAAATSGTVTVTETVPSGLTLASMSGTGWVCITNVCTRSDVLSGGASYPALTVTVNVSPVATSPQVNAVAVTGGGSANASTIDSTVVTRRGRGQITSQ